VDVEEICQQIEAGRISEKDAVAKLVKLGFHPADAEELVFISLGGDDVVLIAPAATSTSTPNTPPGAPWNPVWCPHACFAPAAAS
jgi:hypothetical protein